MKKRSFFSRFDVTIASCFLFGFAYLDDENTLFVAFAMFAIEIDLS